MLSQTPDREADEMKKQDKFTVSESVLSRNADDFREMTVTLVNRMEADDENMLKNIAELCMVGWNVAIAADEDNLISLYRDVMFPPDDALRVFFDEIIQLKRSLYPHDLVMVKEVKASSKDGKVTIALEQDASGLQELVKACSRLMLSQAGAARRARR